MARMKLCAVCDHRNPVGELECERCHASLADAPLVHEPEATGSPQDVDDDESLQPAFGTSYERPDSVALASLEFPWGVLEVKEQVNVGRDREFSPIAERLADNEYVSRRHAVIFLENGFLYVRHIGTSNPTYHNGVPLDADGVAQLADGDEIGFSRHLTARVRLG